MSLPYQTFMSLIGTCGTNSVSLCCEGFLPPSTTSYDDILIQDHEEACFIRFWDVIHEIWVKMWFCNLWWKSVSYGNRWKEKFWSDGNNDLCFRNKWEVWVSCLEKFFSLNKLRWNGNSWKLKLNPFLSRKFQVKLSLLGSSNSLKAKWGKLGS